jgi:hypothetical protein
MSSRLHLFRSARTILCALSALCIVTAAAAQTAPVSAGAPDPQLIEDLVIILARNCTCAAAAAVFPFRA